MTPNQKKKAWRAFFIVVLFAFAFAVYLHQGDVKYLIKAILNSPLTVAFVGIYAAIAVIAHQIFVGGSLGKTGYIYSHFGKYAEPLFAIGTFVVASNTSLALLKGFYLQVAYNESYCVAFSTLDVYSIFLVSTFLLYYSLLMSTRLFIAVISQVDAAEVESGDAT